ncbi:MAG TPA: cytochrome c [Bryobacteraceae bacterium]|jgi:mono/diheme cytochrome c family protein
MRCRGKISLVAFCGTLLFAQADRSVWDGVYTEQQERRGADLYSNECASCHGLSLNGGESAPPLTGGEFLSNWNGLTAGDLFDRIRVSMPADRPGHLSRQQTADILAHIFAVNQFPAGASELDTRTEVLKQIRIDAAKPERRN